MSHFSIAEARALAVGPEVDLAAIDPASTPGISGSSKDIEKATAKIEDEVADLQELLYANKRAGNDPGNVLIVLQGMDTSGKGGAVKHTLAGLDPQGIHIASFGVPTEEEKSHDFLWRVEKALPEAGVVGIFDRSHYEDVLVHRVHQLSSAEEIERRYQAIVDFEQRLVESGTRIIKVMLHISKEFQKENLIERLENPEKHWKYNPGDVNERQLWDDYQTAYEIAIQRTTTDQAPWYVVPSDNKPYARMVVKYLLLDALRSMDLHWPEADFDVAAELERVRNS
ncbi:PPK2 family polyphosphate kinase [Corynebacterium epidermidicanis]|uniref:Polyphosphate:nucleotide phosphotransferase, PPK2 family n=1 Tax=Corynebacterium epidermidicanis TaxID=1050174 RepID=A0A0G3GWP0_9CORY|nr:PPK2 family polyphosphate kinase [Corynebacterium epidermidicanis]AKK03242.1 polyphosphate:nucleotide phosphotransferase, PPK2 family [Corynebacterium epidermidicanis]